METRNLVGTTHNAARITRLGQTVFCLRKGSHLMRMIDTVTPQQNLSSYDHPKCHRLPKHLDIPENEQGAEIRTEKHERRIFRRSTTTWTFWLGDLSISLLPNVFFFKQGHDLDSKRKWNPLWHDDAIFRDFVEFPLLLILLVRNKWLLFKAGINGDPVGFIAGFPTVFISICAQRLGWIYFGLDLSPTCVSRTLLHSASRFIRSCLHHQQHDHQLYYHCHHHQHYLPPSTDQHHQNQHHFYHSHQPHALTVSKCSPFKRDKMQE